MRYSKWFAFALTASVVLAGTTLAQPPDRGRPPFQRGGSLERTIDDLRLSSGKRDAALSAARSYDDNVRRLSNLTGSSLMLKMKDILSADEFKKLREATEIASGRLVTNDVLDRVLTFDTNKDGVVSKEELPERMQDLLAKGDTNKDGVLDKEEIKRLSVTPSDERSDRRGPGGPGGPGGRGNPPTGVAPNVVERALRDLKLTDSKKEATSAAIKANQENIRKVTELARAELVLSLTDVLSESEMKKINEALDRQPMPNDRPPGGPRPPRP